MRRVWDQALIVCCGTNTQCSKLLNLVEGEAVVVASPIGAFEPLEIHYEPLEIHYAETFIVPAAVGRYTVRPLAKAAQPLGMIKTCLRTT